MLLTWLADINGAHGSEVQLLTRVISCSLAFGAVHGLCRLIVRRFPCIEARIHNDWSNRANASLHALIVGVPSFLALVQETPFRRVTASILRLEPRVDAVQGDSQTLHLLLPVSLGYFLYDCIVMALDSSLSSVLFVMHHLMSLLLWPVSFLSQRGQYYVLSLMASEISTPLLHVVAFYLPEHGLGASRYYLPLGVGLILLFFCARVLPIPFVLYSMSATWDFWREPEDRLIFLLWAISVPVPPLMNGYWFWQLVAGAVKAIGMPSNDPQDLKKS